MVALILDLLYKLYRDIKDDPQLKTLNVSTTSMVLITLRPYHENLGIWRTLNKRINFAISLNIPNGQRSML